MEQSLMGLNTQLSKVSMPSNPSTPPPNFQVQAFLSEQIYTKGFSIHATKCLICAHLLKLYFTCIYLSPNLQSLCQLAHIFQRGCVKFFSVLFGTVIQRKKKKTVYTLQFLQTLLSSTLLIQHFQTKVQHFLSRQGEDSTGKGPQKLKALPPTHVLEILDNPGRQAFWEQRTLLGCKGKIRYLN